jgi:16S rRNA (adenine1518-N6/adenine1519-N6)-dimethyltransferase
LHLRNLFEHQGIRPKNKLGQDFLVDLNLIELIVRTAYKCASDLRVIYP